MLDVLRHLFLTSSNKRIVIVEFFFNKYFLNIITGRKSDRRVEKRMFVFSRYFGGLIIE